MKKLYKYIPIVAAMLAMMSCSQEEDFAPQDGKDTPITIASVGVDDAVVTRVATEAYSGEMYVTVKSATNTSAKYNSSDVKWTVTEGTPTIDAAVTPTLYTGEANDQTLWAYTFAGASYTLPTLFTQNEMSAMDFCYGKTTLSDETVDKLSMQHLFSKVTVIAKPGIEITSGMLQFENTADGDGITLTGLLSKVNIDRAYTSTPLSNAGDFDAETKMYYSGYKQEPATGMRSYFNEALLFPSPEQKEIGIRVKQTIDGVERYFTTTFTLSEGIQSGYAYTVNLKVGKDRIEVKSVTISGEPWDENGWGTESEEVELK